MSKAGPELRSDGPRRPLRRAMRIASCMTFDGVGVFGADVDVALGRAVVRPAMAMPSIEGEGVALHQHAVGEGARVALVGVADDVFLVRVREADGVPLDARGEARAAAAAQARRA
jgi:hypothetical protein